MFHPGKSGGAAASCGPRGAAFKVLNTSAVESLMRGLTRMAGRGARPGRGRDALAKAAHPGGAVLKAHRNIRSDCGGSRDEAPGIRCAVIDLQQRPDGCGGIGGAPAKTGGHGYVFLEVELSLDLLAEPVLDRALGLQHEVFAIDEARERPIENEASSAAERTSVRHRNRRTPRGFQFVVAVGASALHMKRQVDLGAGTLTNGISCGAVLSRAAWTRG